MFFVKYKKVSIKTINCKILGVLLFAALETRIVQYPSLAGIWLIESWPVSKSRALKSGKLTDPTTCKFISSIIFVTVSFLNQMCNQKNSLMCLSIFHQMQIVSTTKNIPSSVQTIPSCNGWTMSVAHFVYVIHGLKATQNDSHFNMWEPAPSPILSLCR